MEKSDKYIKYHTHTHDYNVMLVFMLIHFWCFIFMLSILCEAFSLIYRVINKVRFVFGSFYGYYVNFVVAG